MTSNNGGHDGNAAIPGYVQKHLNKLDSTQIQAELQAYAKMQSDMDKEKNGDTKQFMQDTVLYCCEGPMDLSYFYEHRWYDEIKEQRARQKEKIEPIELYAAIESIIANEVDHSAYTTKSSRYPLKIPGNYSAITEAYRLDKDLPHYRLLNSYYQIGSTRVWVGRAIKSILDSLEGRYSLDFKKLERTYQQAMKSKF